MISVKKDRGTKKIEQNETDIFTLESTQTTGRVARETLAELQAIVGLNVDTIYEVRANGLNKGTYRWTTGTTFIKLSDLVNGKIESGNIDAVNGNTISNRLEDKSDLVVGKNKFNKETSKDNYYLSHVHQEVYNTIYYYSDFIPVEAGETYSSEVQIRYTTYFDKYKNFVAGGISIRAYAFLVPATVAFAIVSIEKYRATSDEYQLEKGAAATSYEPYTKTVPSDQINAKGLVVSGNKNAVSGDTVYSNYKDSINNANYTQLLFPSKLEQINHFPNSGEAGFPQSLFESAGGVASLIPTPTDCPFRGDLLPEIYSYVGNSGSDYKIQFPYSFIHKGAVTLSFWIKKSQFEANGTNSIDILTGGSAWIPFILPNVTGGETSDNIHGVTTLKWVYTYGDWIQLQVHYTDFQDADFHLRFGTSSSNTMYFANVVALQKIEDISPFLVRYKYKNSSVESRMQSLESKVSGTKDVVCYGDSLSSSTYPNILQTLLGYDYSVTSRGVGGENLLTILGREGGIPFYVENVVIPATTTPVILGNLAGGSGIKSLYNDTARKPLLQNTANAGINPCYIEDIKCNIEWTGSSYSDPLGNWTLTRLETGIAKTTREKALITTDNMSRFKDAHCSIFMVGTNDGVLDEAEYIIQIEKALSVIVDRKFIVITSHASNSTVTLINLMTKKYGLQYIDLRTYFNSFAIYDAVDKGYLVGSYPTAADLVAMGLGNAPPSLLADTIHFNIEGYKLFGDLIYQKMIELGMHTPLY